FRSGRSVFRRAAASALHDFSGHSTAAEHAHDEEQKDGADSRNDQAAPETAEVEADQPGYERAEECADDADDKVGNEAMFPAHDLFGDPAGKDADHDRADDRNFIHDATPLLGVQRESVPEGSGNTA